MKIQYQEETIEAVFRYFADGFKFTETQGLAKYEATYDPRTGRVIFKLYIKEDEE